MWESTQEVLDNFQDPWAPREALGSSLAHTSHFTIIPLQQPPWAWCQSVVQISCYSPLWEVEPKPVLLLFWPVSCLIVFSLLSLWCREGRYTAYTGILAFVSIFCLFSPVYSALGGGAQGLAFLPLIPFLLCLSISSLLFPGCGICPFVLFPSLGL